MQSAATFSAKELSHRSAQQRKSQTTLHGYRGAFKSGIKKSEKSA
jgi:hypothetical protein